MNKAADNFTIIVITLAHQRPHLPIFRVNSHLDDCLLKRRTLCPEFNIMELSDHARTELTRNEGR